MSTIKTEKNQTDCSSKYYREMRRPNVLKGNPCSQISSKQRTNTTIKWNHQWHKDMQCGIFTYANSSEINNATTSPGCQTQLRTGTLHVLMCYRLVDAASHSNNKGARRRGTIFRKVACTCTGMGLMSIQFIHTYTGTPFLTGKGLVRKYSFCGPLL